MKKITAKAIENAFNNAYEAMNILGGLTEKYILNANESELFEVYTLANAQVKWTREDMMEFGNSKNFDLVNSSINWMRKLRPEVFAA